MELDRKRRERTEKIIKLQKDIYDSKRVMLNKREEERERKQKEKVKRI